VFVVDDDDSIRNSLALFIESAGWQPETFATGREFLARHRALVPSCLLLDVHLPDLSGLDLQRLVAGFAIDANPLARAATTPRCSRICASQSARDSLLFVRVRAPDQE
jgi:DNA-binding NtrC family response regulator